MVRKATNYSSSNEEQTTSTIIPELHHIASHDKGKSTMFQKWDTVLSYRVFVTRSFLALQLC